VHVARDSFRGSSPPAKLAELSTPVLIRTDPEADEVEAFVRLAGPVEAEATGIVFGFARALSDQR
jgi:hypothetical protein